MNGPKHVAIIMDGNGRWGLKKKNSRNLGHKKGIIRVEEVINYNKNKIITEKLISNNLYTKNIPDPEILIRTGNTNRLSNFLLWQINYTEIFFVRKLWPDFNKNDFNKILKKFYQIKRNFGAI